nr:uncharacterized protein LOC123002548 [Drosophila takahashii]
MELLLKDLGGEAFINIFNERHFNLETLKHLKWDQLRGEIPVELVGPAVEFFQRLELWQKNDQDNSIESVFGVSLSNILANSKKGKLIINSYEETKSLNTRTRRELSCSIVENS